MKVSVEGKPQYRPVTLTLEYEEEYQNLLQLMNYIIEKEHDRWGFRGNRLISKVESMADVFRDALLRAQQK